MTIAVRVLFGVLVAATLAAFVVTQHLKRTPPVLLDAGAYPAFISPNGDGARDATRITFASKRADTATISVIDAAGDVVRVLGSRRAPARRRLILAWNGRNDAGAPAPDGPYRVRIDLARQGRSIEVPVLITVDTVAPAPRIARLRPRESRRGPVVLPARGARGVTLRLRRITARAPALLVYRTDGARPRLVLRRLGRPHGGLLTWDGRLDGRPAPPGTYLVAVQVSDLAGNTGTFPARLPPSRGGVPPRLGVTVRYVAASPPLEPVRAGGSARFVVDARGQRYDWALRRVGSSATRARGTASAPLLRVPVPQGDSGLYELVLRVGAHRAAVPLAVRSPRRERVLVVLPTLSWAGRAPIDEAGGGFPQTLDTGGPVSLGRLMPGLPVGFARQEAPLLAFLDRARERYELTTDIALAAARGPRPAGHRGVILAGEPRWEPRALGVALARYVRGGGRVLQLGTDALRRGVTEARGRLVEPSAPAASDVFGVRLAPFVRRARVPIVPDPAIGAARLLGPEAGAGVGRFDAFEAIVAPPSGARLLAAAGPPAGRPVLALLRVGRGLLIRTGLPDWSARLAHDKAVAGITRRAWALLSR